METRPPSVLRSGCSASLSTLGGSDVSLVLGRKFLILTRFPDSLVKINPSVTGSR